MTNSTKPWGWHAGDGTPAHPAIRVEQWPAHNRDRMVHPLYDQPSSPSEMWERFIALLNEREPLTKHTADGHQNFMGSIKRYREMFMEANKEQK